MTATRPGLTPLRRLEEALVEYVSTGASRTSVDNRKFARQCAEEAMALVAAACGAYIVRVPPELLFRAQLEAGSELYNRKSAPNGIAQFAAPDGNPVRIARDPMVAARPILAPFLPLGFA